METRELNISNENLNEVTKRDIFVSSYAKHLFDILFGVVATDCLTVWSIVSNIINIAVFVKQGLKERVTFTLFCLSCSDLWGAVFVTSMTPGFAGNVQILSGVVASSSYIIYLSWYRTGFVDLSTALTVFITIERCACVTQPLHFNTSFIALHGRIIVVGIISFVVANYLPMIATMDFVTTENTENNSSMFELMLSEMNLAIQKYNDLVFGISLAAICQIVVFVCAILMYKGLQKSSKVRTTINMKLKSQYGQAGQGLSTKERRVVKMILVLASLYMVSALPQIVFCWARVLVPELPQDKIGNLHLILGAIIYYTAATQRLNHHPDSPDLLPDVDHPTKHHPDSPDLLPDVDHQIKHHPDSPDLLPDVDHQINHHPDSPDLLPDVDHPTKHHPDIPDLLPEVDHQIKHHPDSPNLLPDVDHQIKHHSDSPDLLPDVDHQIKHHPDSPDLLPDVDHPIKHHPDSPDLLPDVDHPIKHHPDSPDLLPDVDHPIKHHPDSPDLLPDVDHPIKHHCYTRSTTTQFYCR
ncbi:P2Y purinoceptor 2 [Biomphalaria glabrata]